jgi:polyisoprenoid-binding protein YceI
MLETLEAGRFPHVVFKGVGQVAETAPGKPVQARLRGELEFHGVTRPVEVPVEVEFQKGGEARAKGKLTVGLESFRIERPSLLLIKLDDDCRIEFDLALARDE